MSLPVLLAVLSTARARNYQVPCVRCGSCTLPGSRLPVTIAGLKHYTREVGLFNVIS